MTNRPPIRPIFIIGAPRSGTSVMTWALGQHPNIHLLPETAWIASEALGLYQAHADGAARGKLSHLSNCAFPVERFLELHGPALDAVMHEAFERRCADTFGERMEPAPTHLKTRNNPVFLRWSKDEPKTRWVDGTPLNSFYVWGLAKLFPHARFLHHVRAPHAVVASLEKFDNVGADPQTREQGLATWRAHAEAAWLAERALGSQQVFQVDFRRIEADPAELIADILAFLGEEACERCNNPFNQRMNSSGTYKDADARVGEIAKTPGYGESEALYREVLARKRVHAQGDADAQALMEARFIKSASATRLLDH